MYERLVPALASYSPAEATTSEIAGIQLRALSAYYGDFQAVQNVSLDVQANCVTALIGPSGCGKSTLIRCLNRLHEVTRGAWVEGQVLLQGTDLYGAGVDPVAVRRMVGMVFQRPNPFPTMSIFDNVGAGPRLNRLASGSQLAWKVESCLRQAALWDEVKDKLRQPAAALSGGQQQRLCIARALAVDPAVLLMDEPCSALDPISTLRIEDLITLLKQQLTIVIVTHNMQQAARVSDYTAFMLADPSDAGEIVEFGRTRTIFTNPSDSRTESYITGRFG